MTGPTTMRQVVVEAPGRIALRQVALPGPEAGEVRVRGRVVGICGSDLHAVKGLHPFIDLPYVPGHEVVGTVDLVGPGVENVAVGDRVLLEPNLVCGTCWYCRSGRYNLCSDLAVVGCQCAGAMADAFTVSAARLHQVPAGMSDAAAALVEPLSTATHATRLASAVGRGLDGASVAVLGAGTIGLLTLISALSLGAREVAVTDLKASKLDRAKRLGASLAVDPTVPGAFEGIRNSLEHRPDFVFDCVANQQSVVGALSLAEKGGTVVVIGVPEGSVTIDLPIVQDREIAMIGSAMYVAEDVHRAIHLVESGAVRAEDIVTSRYPLEKVGEAFAAAENGEEVKVQLDIS